MNAVEWLTEAVADSVEGQQGGWRSPRTRAGEAGQGLIEYALIVVFVALAAIVALTFLGHGTSNLYSNITNALNTH